MIQHTVAFRLKHPSGSADEREFLDATLEMKDIPGVSNFQRFRQVSKKSSFTFGLSMEFADQEAFDGYCSHPVHQNFVENRWIPEVAEFQEIDYVPFG
ncbi:MAG: Dabb family protein [Verrucomicrobiales bacterium]|nr:Dabb family protein [Verrucomicrobiales bacterium]